MKSFIQFAAGTGTMGLIAPCLFGTPFYHWTVFVLIFVGTMYGVAVMQHYWAHRRSSSRMVVRPGASANGVPPMPI